MHSDGVTECDVSSVQVPCSSPGHLPLPSSESWPTVMQVRFRRNTVLSPPTGNSPEVPAVECRNTVRPRQLRLRIGSTVQVECLFQVVTDFLRIA